MPATLTSFWAWREFLKAELNQRLGNGAAAELAPDYQREAAPLPLNEHLIQLIWAQQLLTPGPLRTMSGQMVRVLDPGRWNAGKGPDFQSARLLLNDQPLDGDVEIHLSGPEWEAHGHHRDLDYNRVVLHVVLSATDDSAHDRLHNGGLIPRLELEPYIFPDLETLRRSLSADDYSYQPPEGVGRCQRLLTGLPAEQLADFLDLAGDERLIAKMRRLEQFSAEDPEELFYQALLLSLGAGAGRTLYYLLARRVPLREALEEAGRAAEPALALESLLLHVAGLVPGLRELEAAPAESRERAELLEKVWAPLAPFWCDRLIPPTRRWFQGIRPVNFATRRLAGVALLLARGLRGGRPPFAHLLAHLRAGAASLENSVPGRRRHPLLRELTAQLTVAGEGHFWGSHYTFTAAPAARPMDLIGEGSAQGLVLNALLPATLWEARRTGDEALALAARRLFGLIPPLQTNHIVEFMSHRLFGDATQAHALLNTERRQQGLFQIFHHCCKGESVHCGACHYFQ